ncbi:MAG: Na+/H+ antiporter NhaA [Proteobacteria bacterium]|nr:Na+/H+ antiporter NhaA [Pseudomonadota bacterium]
MASQNSSPDNALASAINDFMRMESAGGILLLIAALLAILIANSPFADLYGGLLSLTVAIQIGALEINKPLLLWINDGLMAIFFFLIGLELKREVLEGELSSISQVFLPALGALGGMLVPAAIYAWLNWSDPVALDGWAIPVATDIAFALALLSVFGTRVPVALKIFLMTLAIFDDLAAIVVIALFYSGDLSQGALIMAGIVLAAVITMNRLGVRRTSGYILLGVVLWVAVLKSGVHATLAGVLIALCVPTGPPGQPSPLRELENDLHGPVAFAILPLFAFANAGLSLAGITISSLTSSVTFGVITGLVIGKPLGILLFVAIAVLPGFTRLPSQVNWWQLTGVACACGIGFTMSLFIAGLAFEHGGGDYFSADRLGGLIGSILSAVIAYLVLQLSLKKVPADS